MKFHITITRDTINKSIDSGVDSAYGGVQGKSIAETCAFSVAYSELIPRVLVGVSILFLGKDYMPITSVDCTKEQLDFIGQFDRLRYSPIERYNLIGREFDVEIPDKVIEYWFKDAVEVAQKIADSSSLKIRNHSYESDVHKRSMV